MHNVHKRIFVLYFATINTNTNIVTSLSFIAAEAENKQLENDRFILFLKAQDNNKVDKAVQQLDLQITAQIDCTACGNCCKSLMIVVESAEADILSAALQQTRTQFDQQYLEKGSHGMMLINAIPCHFLADNKCTVYEHRFAGCREFPALQIPHINQRLFTIFMHYGRCPIIYNVVEALKVDMNFS